MTRHIWCRTKSELVHGHVERAPDKAVPTWQRLLGLHRQGRIVLFDAVDASKAFAAFDRFLASPKEFAVESAGGTLIEFFASKRSEKVSLDVWFSESDLSEAVVTKQVARDLLQKLFSDATDTELAEFIRSRAIAHN